MRKILLLICILILSFNLAAAVNYNIPLNDYLGETYTGNVDIITFECLDSSCSNTRSVSNIQTFENANLVDYKFPANTNSDMFRIHLLTADHLEKYITLRLDRDSSDDFTYVRSSPLVLEKAVGCSAPITAFTATNKLGAGAPLIIKYKTDIGASLESPFEFYSSLSEVEKQNELLIDSAKTTVRVDIDITNEKGDNVLNDLVYHRLSPNEVKEYEYSWTPQTEGDYSVILTTTVVEDKCLNSVEKSAGLINVNVFRTAPDENVCYVRTQEFKTTQSTTNANGQFLLMGDVYAYRADGSLNANNFEALDVKLTIDFGNLGSQEFDLVNELNGTNSFSLPMKFSEVLQINEPVSTFKDYIFTIHAEPKDDGLCSEVITETQTLDIRKSVTSVNSINGLMIDDIPDAVISNSNKIYSVDLEPLTHAAEGREVSYYAYALGAKADNFNIELVDTIISVSLKQDDYYNQANLANVYVVAEDGENRVVKTFKVRTPSSIERTLAVATIPEEVLVNEPALFDASDSRAEEGNFIVKYTWSFGDDLPEVTTTNPLISHTYFETGFKILQLSVEDNKGNIDTATYLIEVLDGSRNIDVKPSDLQLRKFSFENQEVKTGTQVSTVMTFTNNVGKDLKNVRLILSIKELGIHKIIGPVKIKKSDTWSRRVLLDVPEGTMPGGYFASLMVSNGEFYKHDYTFIRLVEDN